MTAAPSPSRPVELTGNDLTFAQLYDVAFRGEKVSLAPDAVERMKASRAVVERVVASGATAYGINTGFGKLASVRISTEQVRQLQVNLVRSHACGVGAPLSEAETRAMLLLRAKAADPALINADAAVQLAGDQQRIDDRAARSDQTSMRLQT